MFFFKQKTAYDMRISDWSSDVCSSDLPLTVRAEPPTADGRPCARVRMIPERKHSNLGDNVHGAVTLALVDIALFAASHQFGSLNAGHSVRSEEHTSELQSLMRISYAVFCLKKQNTTTHVSRRNDMTNSNNT